MLNLREAAEHVGMSKSSIFRAIKIGRLSATRDEHGGVQIDPSELARVFPRAEERARTVQGEQRGTAPSTEELRVQNAELAARVALLTQMVDDLKGERNRWAAQAERLALTGPPARTWWPWRRTQ